MRREKDKKNKQSETADVRVKIKKAEAAKRSTATDPNTEIKGEDLDSLSSEDESMPNPLQELMAGAQAPKGVPSFESKARIDKLPVIQLLKHHLGSYEGGSKPS